MANKRQTLKEHIRSVLEQLPVDVKVINMEVRVGASPNNDGELVVGTNYYDGSFLRFQLKR